MEGFFSNIIPLIIIVSIVLNIISKRKKAEQRKAEYQTIERKNAAQQPTSIKEIILQQINEQKKAFEEEQKKSTITPVEEIKTPSYEPQEARESSDVNIPSMGVAYTEEVQLNRTSLENTPTELQRHAHKVHIHEAYNEGDALNRISLEGTAGGINVGIDDENVVIRAERHLRKPRTKGNLGEYKALKLNRNSIVNGIIMAEILNKRGGKGFAR